MKETSRLWHARCRLASCPEGSLSVVVGIKRKNEMYVVVVVVVIRVN